MAVETSDRQDTALATLQESLGERTFGKINLLPEERDNEQFLTSGSTLKKLPSQSQMEYWFAHTGFRNKAPDTGELLRSLLTALEV